MACTTSSVCTVTAPISSITSKSSRTLALALLLLAFLLLAVTDQAEGVRARRSAGSVGGAARGGGAPRSYFDCAIYDDLPVILAFALGAMVMGTLRTMGSSSGARGSKALKGDDNLPTL